MDKSHDDNLNPNANSPARPSTAPNSAGAPAPQNPAAPVSNSQNVAFKSDYIGQWTAKQENPFAEQNRKAADKKAAQEASRKKAMPYIKIGSIIAGCITVVAVAAIIFINVTRPKPLPEDITPGSDGAAEITNDAQKVFDKFVDKLGDKTTETDEGPELTDEEMQGALDAVADYFEQQNNRTEDITTKVNLVLIEMQFYGYKGQPEAIIKAAEGFNIDDMTTSQAQQFLGMLMDASFGVGDNEAGEKYAQQFSSLFASGEADEGEKEEW